MTGPTSKQDRILVEEQRRNGRPADALGGAELLTEIRKYVGRFIVLPSDEAADLIALWVLHTHAFDAARATPYLRITSATPNSGKTLLLEILAELCVRGWYVIGPSVAVLFRKIDRDRPTLLLDEMDNWPLDDRREAVGVLNGGYRRGGRVPRVADNGRLQEFECYCPKAYAGLDTEPLPPALLSRSVTIRMETKLASDSVELWLGVVADADADAAPLRNACAKWAEANVEVLAQRRPTLPAKLQNRSAEVWWALLALAEHVGGDWPQRARKAATKLSAGGDAADPLAESVQLLTDVRAGFGDEQTIPTTALLAYLNGLDESPWGARRKGEGLDARGLAKMLRKFRTSEGAPIRPKVVRVGESTPRGYEWQQFADAFERYLSEAQQAQQAQQVSPDAEPDVADVADVADFSKGLVDEGSE